MCSYEGLQNYIEEINTYLSHKHVQKILSSDTVVEKSKLLKPTLNRLININRSFILTYAFTVFYSVKYE